MISNAWWRFDWAPTAEEWQALWAMLTLIVAVLGVVFALRQLRQGSEQLGLAAEANVRAAEAAESEARPYLSIRLDLRVQAASNPKNGGGEGLIFIVIESVGRTPAREISLTVEPEFRTSGRGRPDGEIDPVRDALVFMFSGQPVIGMLGTGQSLDYFLDFAREALSDELDLPKRYVVTASYWDAARQRDYSEPHILDLAPWGPAVMTAEPMDVIARQMRRLNEKLEARG